MGKEKIDQQDVKLNTVDSSSKIDAIKQLIFGENMQFDVMGGTLSHFQKYVRRYLILICIFFFPRQLYQKCTLKIEGLLFVHKPPSSLAFYVR